MEKAKLALLAVIALALCVQTWDRVVPEAHAQSADIVRTAWRHPQPVGSKDDEKVLAPAIAYAGKVRTWLLGHPGDTIFQTTFTAIGGCVHRHRVRAHAVVTGAQAQ